MKNYNIKLILVAFVLLVVLAAVWNQWGGPPKDGGLLDNKSGDNAAALPPRFEPTPEEIETRTSAFKQKVQMVIKTLTDVDLPQSCAEFGLDQGFRMSAEDAGQLIGVFEIMEKKRVNIPGLLDYVTVSKRKTGLSGVRLKITPGHYSICIYPESSAGTKVGRSEGFDIGDTYSLLLDPATGWAQWWFTPANVSDD
jgi:hypothetical protein